MNVQVPSNRRRLSSSLVIGVLPLALVCASALALGCASGGGAAEPPAVGGTPDDSAVNGVTVPEAAPATVVPDASGVPGDFGVLVMAHGGTDVWDEAVLEAVREMGAGYPVEVAFGMASADSLQAATDKLEAQGVRRIGVVRLFVSGESWLERTRQILGLEPGAPDRAEVPAADGGGQVSGHGGGHHDFAATFWRIESESEFSVSGQGLSEAAGMSRVLVDRARALSADPGRESVLILAHGPGDDEENRRWIANLEDLARPLTDEMGFERVEVETLREDWAGKREVAEARIRSFVESASEGDGRCLVIPFRVFGFGPYGDVLEGLEYSSDGRGLLPHEAVSAWMAEQAEMLARGPFGPGVADAATLTSAGSPPNPPESSANRP